MMTNEYKAARNNARKAQNEVKEILKKFAKRSKYITYQRDDTFYGFCRIDVAVSNDGKVVREMMEYLKSICPFCDDSDEDTTWFHNYEENPLREDVDDWEVQFEICVSCR
jgi:hypothetical protein